MVRKKIPYLYVLIYFNRLMEKCSLNVDHPSVRHFVSYLDIP